MKKANNDYTLGVIVTYTALNKTPPFSETRFFYQLAVEGKPFHIHVVVFDPKEIDWKSRTVVAWRVDVQKNWYKTRINLPKVIYDRCYYTTQKHYLEYKETLLRMNEDPRIRFLGRPLGGKSQTHDILKKYEDIQPFLPLTHRFHEVEEVISFLNECKAILLKPNGGSHGRGIVAVYKEEDHIKIKGRSKSNKPFQYKVKDEEILKLWVHRFVDKTRYIMQPFLDLSTKENHPFDIRILVQKNGEKEWETTGSAVRIGEAHTITSNLHGGGTATSVQPFLEENYPRGLIPKIHDQLEKVTALIPKTIEEHHGPLIELGLDVGIDRQGSVWLLEVNSKPGRSIFLQTKEKEIRRRSVQLPMSYAYTLLKEHPGGHHEFNDCENTHSSPNPI